MSYIFESRLFSHSAEQIDQNIKYKDICCTVNTDKYYTVINYKSVQQKTIVNGCPWLHLLK